MPPVQAMPPVRGTRLAAPDTAVNPGDRHSDHHADGIGCGIVPVRSAAGYEMLAQFERSTHRDRRQRKQDSQLPIPRSGERQEAQQ